MLRSILHVLARAIATPVRRRLFAFEAATHRPREMQENVLERILAQQRNMAERAGTCRR